MKKKVIYIPRNLSNSGTTNKSLKYIIKNKDKYEFICKIDNDNFNYPIIDEREPLFFNHSSGKLIKLLRMSENIKEFNKLLKSCVLYIHLIRCYFIINFTKSLSKPSKSLTKTHYKSLPLSLVRTKTKTKTKTPARKYHSI